MRSLVLFGIGFSISQGHIAHYFQQLLVRTELLVEVGHEVVRVDALKGPVHPEELVPIKDILKPINHPINRISYALHVPVNYLQLNRVRLRHLILITFPTGSILLSLICTALAIIGKRPPVIWVPHSPHSDYEGRSYWQAKWSYPEVVQARRTSRAIWIC